MSLLLEAVPVLTSPMRGQEHGRLGICGPDSVFFFTMHLALYLLGTVLPKTHIRFLIENAGSMHYDHFTFIRACLGLAHITRDKMTVVYF